MRLITYMFSTCLCLWLFFSSIAYTPTLPHQHPAPEAVVQHVQRHFKWEVEYMFGTPDCVVGINGQFPGPTIRAKAGDTISVEVTNKLHTVGVVIHWHGITKVIREWYKELKGQEGKTNTGGRAMAVQMMDSPLNFEENGEEEKKDLQGQSLTDIIQQEVMKLMKGKMQLENNQGELCSSRGLCRSDTIPSAEIETHSSPRVDTVVHTEPVSDELILENLSPNHVDMYSQPIPLEHSLPRHSFRSKQQPKWMNDYAGTYVYHGHFGMQRSARLYGSLIIDLGDGEKGPFHYDGVHDQEADPSSKPFRWTRGPRKLLIKDDKEIRRNMASVHGSTSNPSGSESFSPDDQLP
ncbi:hypothetical protein Patl1_24688 [Pistacia atlantica]|uniref:Uncharacterized protein n=1 Tax=Pistacia atlantica TaxID=434234 RepID=A0ACC1B2W4_9ROSI|nr:hypothetical protein Patl1_24688 [Pistacia atlantica]